MTAQAQAGSVKQTSQALTALQQKEAGWNTSPVTSPFYPYGIGSVRLSNPLSIPRQDNCLLRAREQQHTGHGRRHQLQQLRIQTKDITEFQGSRKANPGLKDCSTSSYAESTALFLQTALLRRVPMAKVSEDLRVGLQSQPWASQHLSQSARYWPSLICVETKSAENPGQQ